MLPIQRMNGIRPDYDVSLIATRLGHHKAFGALSEVAQEHLDAMIRQAEDLCDIQVSWRIVQILENDGHSVLLEDASRLIGIGVSKLLSGCPELLAMFATAGKQPIQKRDEWSSAGRLSDAVVLDAAASEITDAGLDWVMHYVNSILRRTGRVTTRLRYSPGYGDWALEQQSTLAGLLDIGQQGAFLTERSILVPEKSVLAVAGIAGMAAREGTDDEKAVCKPV